MTNNLQKRKHILLITYFFSLTLQNYYIKLPKPVSEIKKMQKIFIFLHFEHNFA